MSCERKTCPAQECLPPRTYGEAIEASKDLPDGNQTATLLLLSQMSVDFWGLKRKEQVLRLLDNMKEMGVTQSDIATVMGVSNALVTKYKHQLQEHPDDLFRKPGRPSILGDVLEKIGVHREGAGRTPLCHVGCSDGVLGRRAQHPRDQETPPGVHERARLRVRLVNSN